MKKALKTILLLGILTLVTGNAWALPVAGDIIRMDLGDIYQMTITQSANSDSVGEVYQSFCLERWVYFTPGNEYSVQSVGDYATGGGGGVFDPALGDEVSKETKWLFAAYRSGILGSASALEVQNAIWYLEGEFGYSASNWTNTFQGIYNSSDVDGLLAGWIIQAVNIVDGGRDAQSQLVGSVAPVPEPATMLLLGTGLLGMAGLGRKRLKK